MSASPVPAQGPPSLLGVTVRRSIVSGRMYLGTGIGMNLVYGVILALVSGPSFASAFPLILPLFATTGSLGALMVFTSDRLKGVLEYLVAYGVSPRRLFANVIANALTLLTIVLSVGLAAGLGIYVARGHVISVALGTFLIDYSIPMAFASAAFAASLGMFWTSLSSPREGMNSPIGLMPIIGIAPSLLTLVSVGVIEASHPVPLYEITSVAVAVVLVVVVVLLSLVGRLLPRERLLSPV